MTLSWRWRRRSVPSDSTGTRFGSAATRGETSERLRRCMNPVAPIIRTNGNPVGRGVLPIAWSLAAVVSVLCLAFLPEVRAQTSGVPIGKNGGVDMAVMGQKAEALKGRGVLLNQETAEAQLRRTNCVLPLNTKPGKKPLAGKQVWQRSRASFVRIGWYFLCPNCDRRHINFGGGFYVTKGGVVATAHHVVAIQKGMRDGYLVAATEDGEVTPVEEILAGNEADDVALVRIKPLGKVQTLAINPDVSPGDVAWCYSNPLERSGYFSGGFVTRFTDLNAGKGGSPMVRMGVSTDWAPGSSGAAVLDGCGNAIGLVSAIEVLMAPGGNKEQYMAIHHAACAANILKLITPAK
jgi:hypothetical protein